MHVFFKFLLLFFLIFSLAACNKQESSNKIVLCKVKKNSENIFIGNVKSQFTSSISFRIDGIITYLPYSKGDFVKKGQILAKLDNRLYKFKKNQEDALLEESEIKFKQSKNYYDRMSILHSSGAVSDNDWEQAGFDVDARLKEIELSKERANYAKRELTFTSLKMPYDGYILERVSDIGSYVLPSQEIYLISSSVYTQIEVVVPSLMINKLNIDDDADLVRNNISYKGKIKHISQSSRNSGGYLVKIFLDKNYPELKEGMNLDVRFAKLNSETLYIPLISIVDEKYVYKVVNNKILKQKITLGNVLNEDIEVLSGLNEGDVVILEGQENVKENMEYKN